MNSSANLTLLDLWHERGSYFRPTSAQSSVDWVINKKSRSSTLNSARITCSHHFSPSLSFAHTTDKNEKFQPSKKKKKLINRMWKQADRKAPPNYNNLAITFTVESLAQYAHTRPSFSMLHNATFGNTTTRFMYSHYRYSLLQYNVGRWCSMNTSAATDVWKCILCWSSRILSHAYFYGRSRGKR